MKKYNVQVTLEYYDVEADDEETAAKQCCDLINTQMWDQSYVMDYKVFEALE